MAHSLSADSFDLADTAIQADPYPFYPVLRQERPVLKTSFFGQPCWVLSRRKDITAVLMDPKTYSSRTTPISSFLFDDAPNHGRLRQMVAPMFTRTAIQSMSEMIRLRADALFASCVSAVRCDAVADFASPLTIYVMGELLGIPVDQVESIRAWSHGVAEHLFAMRLGRVPLPEAQAANDALTEFFVRLAETQTYMADGALAVFGEAYRSGELTREALVGNATILFLAGHTTTTNLIANSIYMLTQRPEDLAMITNEEGFTIRFIEEVLRTRPSFHRILRITTRHVELHGEHIPEGSIIRLLLASANRDSDYFPDGETFDPSREGRLHSAFGLGIHTCLGSWLARLESNIALSIVARSASAIALDPDRAPTPFAGGTFNEFGFEQLPIVVAAA